MGKPAGCFPDDFLPVFCKTELLIDGFQDESGLGFFCLLAFFLMISSFSFAILKLMGIETTSLYRSKANVSQEKKAVKIISHIHNNGSLTEFADTENEKNQSG